ncbi:MAG: helix-turn-helix transcriptional regulator [Ancrocorticia sp.]|jgi:DNA-binding HxlR family transcriptional regulator|nr:helix-turn-helix transcriptional regulator [Ancrocorticia sp.]
MSSYENESQAGRALASAEAIAACPSFVSAMNIVGKRWSGLIVGAMAHGCETFSEISRYAADLSDAVLARRLRELEADGVISRTVVATHPPSVRYALTPAGQALAPILDELTAWGQQYLTGDTQRAGESQEDEQ